MPVDPEVAKTLNLLRGNPTFIVTEAGTVKKVESVSADAGVSLVAGQTQLANGVEVESVFEMQTDGGEVHAIFWCLDGTWWDSNDEDARRLVAASDAEIFPLDWRTAVPLEVDHYHGDPPRPSRRKLP